MNLPPPESIFALLADWQEQGRTAVLAVVVASQGSTPQKAGAKMLIGADGQTVGTVGGGVLEERILREAAAVLQAGVPRLLEVDLTAGGGALCGGRVQVYLEPILPPPELYIVGAGHVGSALARLAACIGFRVTILDDREVPSPADGENIRCHRIRDPAQPFVAHPVGPEAYIVIASRSHQHDLEALAAALRTPAGYIGLLGSSRKAAAVARKLLDEGFTPADLARVYTPVGVDVGAVGPAEIAVSIAAQLIARRRKYATFDHSPALSRRLLQPHGPA